MRQVLGAGHHHCEPGFPDHWDQIATVAPTPGSVTGRHYTPGQSILATTVFPATLFRPAPRRRSSLSPMDPSLCWTQTRLLRSASPGTCPVWTFVRRPLSLKSLNSIRIMAGSRPINPTSLTGSFGSHPRGFWTPAHTAIVVAGVGGATAAALGVGAAQSNSGGPQVSPSH